VSAPNDQAARDRFITEHDRNFSVVASAGSGKTRAITDRIVALARGPHAEEWLPTLLVVTYTNRAAGEMQQRARQSLLEARLPLEVLTAFNRAFFGTIHSLCLRLLAQHAHHLGLPGRLDLLTDDEALWQKFVQRHTTVGCHLTPEQRTALLQLVPVRHLMELGRTASFDATPVTPGDFPEFDFDEVYAFAPAQKKSQPPVDRSHAALRSWEKQWAAGGFAPLPQSEGVPIRAVWDAALGPLRAWRQQAALCVAAEVAEAYRTFRLAEGQITFDDQVTLAHALLRQPEAARAIRTSGYRVILDEAQDTDPKQFDVLLALTRPNDAAPPRAGHFSMVGDFQQSIYGRRADLTHYRSVHQELLTSGAGEELTFSVTFRLDEQVLDFVNASFPHILQGQERQVDFVPLQTRPDVLPGQVVRCELGELPIFPNRQEGPKAWLEAQRLARWLRAQGLDRLRAEKWSEVAILCPRKGWFPMLRAALRAENFAVQIQSERDAKGDSPAYAWFTALVVILADPHEGYEIVGVLREVFGLSDHDLAIFGEGQGTRFQIAHPTPGSGVVAEKLNDLHSLRERILTAPLFSAMQEMVAASLLRERLLSLPMEQLSEELDDLLTQAATAEATDTTLAAFADSLREGCRSVREVRATEPEAIQIITGHKAKGSEWQAVIVPYLGRNVRAFTADYPRLFRDPRDRQPGVAIDKGDLDDALDAALKLAERQESERLLYVALTRARHTLVLVDDRDLFAGKSGVPKNAPARWLQCAAQERNQAVFAVLPCTPEANAATADAQLLRKQHRAAESTVPPLAPLPANAVRIARGNAAAFLKRNPSALAEAALAEADPAAYLETARRPATLPNAGQRYGTWWHEFVERLDWSAGAKSWDAVFHEALPTAPDPELAGHEWQLLRAQLTTETELARTLCAPQSVAHAEMPFLWAMNERECLDGIIDLAVFDPVRGSWLILDWKTNRTTPAKLPELRAHYLPQLSAYWRAATAMLKAPVIAGIYSTATGQWLPYEEAELQAAWAKISAAPEELEMLLAEE